MLKLNRPYSGMQKIYDREEKDGQFIEKPIVLLSKDGYSPKMAVRYNEVEKDGKMIREREEYMVYGKSFEVNDEAYVLERHGAILEKA